MEALKFGLDTITNMTADQLRVLLKEKEDTIIVLEQTIEKQAAIINDLARRVSRLSPVWDEEGKKLVYPKPGSDLRY